MAIASGAEAACPIDKHTFHTRPPWELNLEQTTTNSDWEQPFTIVDRAIHPLP
jgi:hypothetical protein